jgi:hypothetical protein
MMSKKSPKALPFKKMLVYPIIVHMYHAVELARVLGPPVRRDA